MQVMPISSPSRSILPLNENEDDFTGEQAAAMNANIHDCLTMLQREPIVCYIALSVRWVRMDDDAKQCLDSTRNHPESIFPCLFHPSISTHKRSQPRLKAV